MPLAEVAAVDADAGSSSSVSLSLFVHCSRHSASSSSPSERPNTSIHVQLLDPPTLYEADVTSSHKPRALDCSGAEYVASVETALRATASGQAPRFEFRWSKQKRTLTLMERTGFAMKFCAVEFQASDTWRELLHQVATQQAEAAELVVEKQSKMQQCVTLLGQKGALLETALAAKQKTEDQLFRGFCAVLNTKKDEIRRLQQELKRAQEMHRYDTKPAAKQKVVAPKEKRKATGAKLKRETVEEEEDEDISDASSGEESAGDMTVSEEDEDDEGGQRKRVKNEVIKAYSELPANLRSSSVQISSAEDLLSSMDDIIKNDEERNEATQRGDNSRCVRSIKSEPVGTRSNAVELSKPRSGSRMRKATAVAVKAEPTPPPKSEPVKPSRPAPQVDEEMDSEEEDILDMLS